jgi:hypothetical protein
MLTSYRQKYNPKKPKAKIRRLEKCCASISQKIFFNLKNKENPYFI